MDTAGSPAPKGFAGNQLRNSPRESVTATRTSLLKLLRRFGIFGLRGVLFFLVVEYLILPNLAGPSKALHLFGGANYGLVAIAFGLEVFALFAYAQLTHSVLPRPAPAVWRLFRIDLSSLAVSHVLPGGAASGTGIGLKLLTASGVSGTDAGFAIAIQGIGSAIVLNVILWLALIISIPLNGFDPIYAITALVGALLIAAFAGLLALFTKNESRAVQVVGRIAGRIPFIKPGSAERTFVRVGERIQELWRNPDLLKKALFWATINWLADAASLWIMVAAFGHLISPVSLLVSYGLANVLAAIPITPGGLGLVEPALIKLLGGFGVTRGVAIISVICYRLFNFWLPIPAGAAAYVSLRVKGAAPQAIETMELDAIDPRTSSPKSADEDPFS